MLCGLFGAVFVELAPDFPIWSLSCCYTIFKIRFLIKFRQLGKVDGKQADMRPLKRRSGKTETSEAISPDVAYGRGQSQDPTDICDV